MENPERILLFDGVCNLCNGLVQFIIDQDPKGKFHFASLQSDAGQKLLRKFNLRRDDFDSFVYVHGEKFFLKSTAALHVLRELGGFWRIFFPFIILPKFLRDWMYDRVAKNRYKIFGRQETCWIPTPELKARFLE